MKGRPTSMIPYASPNPTLKLLKNVGSPEFFPLKNGWKLAGSGLFKQCLMKKSIIIKYPKSYDVYNKMEILREYDQWKAPPDKHFKKHLPTTYILINDEILIQDIVLNKCIPSLGCKNKSQLLELVDRYNLQDYNNNHGHTRTGRIKFFDSVWKRNRFIK